MPTNNAKITLEGERYDLEPLVQALFSQDLKLGFKKPNSESYFTLGSMMKLLDQIGPESPRYHPLFSNHHSLLHVLKFHRDQIHNQTTFPFKRDIKLIPSSHLLMFNDERDLQIFYVFDTEELVIQNKRNPAESHINPYTQRPFPAQILNRLQPDTRYRFNLSPLVGWSLVFSIVSVAVRFNLLSANSVDFMIFPLLPAAAVFSIFTSMRETKHSSIFSHPRDQQNSQTASQYPIRPNR